MRTFSELIPEFYRFLTLQGTCSPSVITNYISWLKFLDSQYQLTTDFSESKMESIIKSEEVNQQGRGIYSTKKDLSNFKSSLRKFREFLNSDVMQLLKQVWQKDEEQVNEIEQSNSLTADVKEALIMARVGQGNFRKKLLEYWKGCSVTGLRRQDLLVASHIKPWRIADNIERLDLFNGFLLNPTLDKLFDRGYVSFDKQGKILISNLLTKEEQVLLNLTSCMNLIKHDDKHQLYLCYHRDNIYLA